MYKHNTCMYACICTHIHVCMYKYVFMYINIHIYTNKLYTLNICKGKIVNYTPVKLGKKSSVKKDHTCDTQSMHNTSDYRT